MEMRLEMTMRQVSQERRTVTQYFINYDHANEDCYVIYVVSKGDVPRFRKLFPDSVRITRPRAIDWGWTQPREAARNGERYPGGFAARQTAQTAALSSSLDALTTCKVATKELMDHMERDTADRSVGGD